MIDLNRLREAAELADEEGPQNAWWEFAEAGRAVLDAPRVWWCDGTIYATFNRVREECDPDQKEHARCRWVALVPITGDGR